MKSFRFKRPVDVAFAEAYRAVNGEDAPAWLEGAVPAISLVSHTALSTAFGNDEASVGVFAQQVYGYGEPGDVLLAISTSGNSANVVEATKVARAKGVKESKVIFSHALRNALIPVVTVVGAQLTMVVGGSFIIESVFSIPGIGMLLLSAINTRDFPTIQGTVLVLSFFVCIINLLTDVAYAYVDPRIKSQYAGKKRSSSKRKEVRNVQA